MYFSIHLKQDISQFEWDLSRMNLILCMNDGKKSILVRYKNTKWSIRFLFLFVSFEKNLFQSACFAIRLSHEQHGVYFVNWFLFLYVPWMIKAPWLLIHSTNKEKRRIRPLLHFVDRCNIFSEIKRIEIVFSDTTYKTSGLAYTVEHKKNTKLQNRFENRCRTLRPELLVNLSPKVSNRIRAIFSKFTSIFSKQILLNPLGFFHFLFSWIGASDISFQLNFTSWHKNVIFIL